MRLPDDYEDHGGGLTPTVISAIVAVTIFVAVILTVVLIMNRQPTSHQQNNTAAQTENVQQAGNNRKHIDSFGSGFLGHVPGDYGNTIAVCGAFPKG